MKTIELKTDGVQLPYLAEAIDGAIRSLATGFHSQSSFDSEQRSTTYRFSHEGADYEFVVELHSKGISRLLFPDDYSVEKCGVVIDAIKGFRASWYRAVVPVESGTKVVPVDLDMGQMRLVVGRVSTERRFPTAPSQWTVVTVPRQALVLSTVAADESAARGRAGSVAEQACAVISLLFDTPFSVFGHPHVWVADGDGPIGEHEWGGLKVAALAEAPEGLGGDHEPQRLASCGVHPVAFAEHLDRLHGKARQKVLHCLATFRRALVLLEPGPGAEKFRDPSVAVVLFLSVIDSLGPRPGEGPLCEGCERPLSAPATRRVQARVQALRPDLTSAAVEDLLRPFQMARNRLVHGAKGSTWNLGPDSQPLFWVPELELEYRGVPLLRDLARRALFDGLGFRDALG